jgi:hypothetical protein
MPQAQIASTSTHDGAEAQLFVVPRDQVAYAWPEIASHISRIKDAEWTLGDIRRSLDEGFAQAWGMRTAERVLGFWITRIDNTYTHTYGLVWILAGEGIEAGLAAYRQFIEPWFWSQGCEWIEIHGRKGWKRALPDYEERAVILRKYR